MLLEVCLLSLWSMVSLREVCSAKIRRLGEKVGQAWRLHVHPQDSTKAAYVNSSGDVEWSLHEIEVPTVEQYAREDAIVRFRTFANLA